MWDPDPSARRAIVDGRLPRVRGRGSGRRSRGIGGWIRRSRVGRAGGGGGGGARGETAREGARGGRAARRAFARAASGTRRARRAGGSWTGAHLGRGVLRGLVLRQALVFQHVHQGGLAGVVETLETRGGRREGGVSARPGREISCLPRSRGEEAKDGASRGVATSATRRRGAPGRGSWRSSATDRAWRECRRTSS